MPRAARPPVRNSLLFLYRLLFGRKSAWVPTNRMYTLTPGIEDTHDPSIVVALDSEDHTAVANDTGAGPPFRYLRRCIPVLPSDLLVPVIQVAPWRPGAAPRTPGALFSDFTSDSGQRSSRPWRFGSLAASAFLLPRGSGPLWDGVRCGCGCGGEWKFAAWGRVPQWASGGGRRSFLSRRQSFPVRLSRHGPSLPGV